MLVLNQQCSEITNEFDTGSGIDRELELLVGEY